MPRAPPGKPPKPRSRCPLPCPCPPAWYWCPCRDSGLPDSRAQRACWARALARPHMARVVPARVAAKKKCLSFVSSESPIKIDGEAASKATPGHHQSRIDSLLVRIIRFNRRGAMASTMTAGLTGLRERYRLVRERSLRLCKPLTPEDMMVQSCPEASPAKWHIAHTAWFFESFLVN